MEAKRRTFWFIIVAFVLGVVAGGFVGSTYFGKRNAFRGKPTREDVQKEFTTKLQLTPAQSISVDSVLEVSRAKFSAMSKRYSESFKTNRDSLRMEIRKLLTPEQNKLYDNYIKEIDEREKRWRQGTR